MKIALKHLRTLIKEAVEDMDYENRMFHASREELRDEVRRLGQQIQTAHKHKLDTRELDSKLKMVTRLLLMKQEDMQESNKGPFPYMYVVHPVKSRKTMMVCGGDEDIHFALREMFGRGYNVWSARPDLLSAKAIIVVSNNENPNPDKDLVAVPVQTMSQARQTIEQIVKSV